MRTSIVVFIIIEQNQKKKNKYHLKGKQRNKLWYSNAMENYIYTHTHTHTQTHTHKWTTATHNNMDYYHSMMSERSWIQKSMPMYYVWFHLYGVQEWEKLNLNNNQNCMVLAQKQTHRSIKQTRDPRNKPIPLWSIILQQRKQEYTMKKR